VPKGSRAEFASVHAERYAKDRPESSPRHEQFVRFP
jgi:hypothetical protein